MSSEVAVFFDNVSKKYSKNSKHHGTLRDDIVSFLSGNISKRDKLSLNEFWALKNISFEIRKGENIGLYGPNGSGKSTIFKLIANIISPTAGSVHIKGRIAPLIELGAGFHPDLNGLENIYMNGTILGMTIKEIKSKLSQIIAYSELKDFIDTPVKKYSSGMKLRLGFSVAIHSNADIFLFDEVLAVGDEAFRKKSYASIQSLTESGKTLLIVSHNIESLTRITDRIIHIEKGEILH